MEHGKFFTTRANQVRKEFNQDKIKQQEANDPLKPYKPHKLGTIPAFYPQNKLNELRHFSTEMTGTVDNKSRTIQPGSQDYRDILAKVVNSGIPGHSRPSHKQ
jgi:hypothetical protein